MPKRKSKPNAHATQASNAVNEERVINRWMMYATWTGSIIAFIAVVSSLVFFFITQSIAKETLVITNVQRITIAQTHIKPFADFTNSRATTTTTGILSSYWKVFLSNNSNKDISIVSSRVLQISSKDYPAISYTDMDQGLYLVEENDVKSLSLPLTIASGVTIPIFVKIGVVMESEAYHFVIDKYGDKPQYEMHDIETYLRTAYSIDIYGNPLKQTAPGVWKYPALDKIKEQVFGLSFKTARGTKATELASWYVYSGFLNQFNQR